MIILQQQITRTFAPQDATTPEPAVAPEDPNPLVPPTPDRFSPFNPRFEVS